MGAPGRGGQGGHRTKKLLEVARWHYTGIFDEKKRLIAGATFCESRCHTRLRELGAQLGMRFEKGTCFFKKDAGPGGCINPCPTVGPENQRVWELWEETWDATTFRGMDGEPTGRRTADVESAARALGTPWNRFTFKKYRLILTVWLSKVREEIAERDRKRKWQSSSKNR